MAQPNLIPKRISALPKMIDDVVTAELEDDTKAGQWAMAIDSLRRSNEEDRPEGSGLVNGEDAGSLYVPMNRLALRDLNGKIPAAMLPSYVDDMAFGTMVFDAANHKAIFYEVFYDPHTGSTQRRTYVSPNPDTESGEYFPSENIVYVDSISKETHEATDIQYRFISTQSETAPTYGFKEVPGSRALNGEHGAVVQNGANNMANVAVKTPDMILRSDAGTATDIAGGDVWSSWDVVQIGPECDGDITCTERTSGANKYVELGGLHAKDTTTATKQESRYKVTLQLLAKPKTDQMMSADIYTVKLVAPDIHAETVAEMDMSGPSGAWNVLNFELDLFLQYATTMRLYLTTDMPSGTTLSAKVQNFSVVELL